MPTLKYIFLIILVALVSLFAVKNMHPVEVHFYNRTFDDDFIRVPAMVVVLGAFGLGFLIAWFFELYTRLKFKTQLRMREREIESLEEELQHLKPPPPELTPQSENPAPATDS
jgi:uncharacterized integral membrane protein